MEEGEWKERNIIVGGLVTRKVTLCEKPGRAPRFRSCVGLFSLSLHLPQLKL